MSTDIRRASVHELENLLAVVIGLKDQQIKALNHFSDSGSPLSIMPWHIFEAKLKNSIDSAKIREYDKNRCQKS